MTSVAVQPFSAGESSSLVERCRVVQRRTMRADADRLELVAEVLVACEADVPVTGLRVADRRVFVRDVATAEVAATFGVPEHLASRWVALAERTSRVLPVVLDALRGGVLDLARAQVLVEATEVLDDDLAAAVAADLVAQAGSAPWDGPSPRAWRARVDRAVVRADADAAAARQRRERAAREVRAWPLPDGGGMFQLRAGAADVAMVSRVVDDLANAGPSHDQDGVRLTLDQRRADAVVALFRRVREGGERAGLPVVPVRRATDLGLVLHADTLFADGPRRDATGEQRGLGRPAAVDPSTARRRAQHELRSGTGVQVLLVDADGGLRDVVRLPASACADRASLRAALRTAPRAVLATHRYVPTAAIVRHVRAAAPTCSAYDCGRPATSCDLDHDEPWPRGPTSVTNLDPKCRRHHQAKTHGVVRSRLAARGPDGRTVTWAHRDGLTVTTRPEPLPGC